MGMITVSVMSPDSPVYQGWSPCMDWCRDNCVGDWRYQTEGVFDFELEKDATMFMLKWG